MTNFAYCFQQWDLLRLHVTYRTIRHTQKYILRYVSKFLDLINLLLEKKPLQNHFERSKYIAKSFWKDQNTFTQTQLAFSLKDELKIRQSLPADSLQGFSQIVRFKVPWGVICIVNLQVKNVALNSLAD